MFCIWLEVALDKGLSPYLMGITGDFKGKKECLFWALKVVMVIGLQKKVCK